MPSVLLTVPRIYSVLLLVMPSVLLTVPRICSATWSMMGVSWLCPIREIIGKRQVAPDDEANDGDGVVAIVVVVAAVLLYSYSSSWSVSSSGGAVFWRCGTLPDARTVRELHLWSSPDLPVPICVRAQYQQPHRGSPQGHLRGEMWRFLPACHFYWIQNKGKCISQSGVTISFCLIYQERDQHNVKYLCLVLLVWYTSYRFLLIELIELDWFSAMRSSDICTAP